MWSKWKVIGACCVIYVISFGRALVRPIFGGEHKLRFSNITGRWEPQCYDKAGSPFVTWFNLFGWTVFFFMVSMIILFVNYKIARALRSEKFLELAKMNPSVMNQRRSVVRMLVVMVLAFLMLWGMIFALMFMMVFPSFKVFSKTNWFTVYVFFARIFEYGSCVINPFIFIFMSSTFRKELRKMCVRCLPGYALSSDQKEIMNTNSSSGIHKISMTNEYPSKTSATDVSLYSG